MYLSSRNSLPQIGDLFPCPQHQSNPGRQGAPFPSSFSRRLRVIPQRTREPGTPPAPTMQPGTAELLRSLSGQCVQPWFQNVGLSLFEQVRLMGGHGSAPPETVHCYQSGESNAGKANSRAVHHTRILSPASWSTFLLDNLNYFCDFECCLDGGPASLIIFIRNSSH